MTDGLPSPADTGGLLGGEDLEGKLQRFLARARGDETVAQRVRERWQLQVARESATFAGLLVDLAEGAQTVVLRSITGRQHRGQVRLVGTDFCCLATEAGRDVLVAFAGIGWLRPEEKTEVAGERPPPVIIGLAEALAAIADDRPRVSMGTKGPEVLVGELRWVGDDVVTVVLDGNGGTVHLPAGAVVEVALV